MSNRIFTVAILGCGARGAETYGSLCAENGDKFKIVSLCDIDRVKLDKYAERFGIDRQNCFLEEDSFFKERRSDLLIIATLDADHVRQCIKGIELGYDILLEKPITDNLEECKKLLEVKNKSKSKVLICHVLRYAKAFMKTAELLNSGIIGKLVTMQAIEQVAYWHQAHSYVRGNWRNREQSTPMILAKCCHDLDLLQYYAKSRCKTVSSMGNLFFFKSENAPQDAARRCLQCKYAESCPYSAKKIYIDGWKTGGNNENIWPQNVLTTKTPLTEENIYEALENGPYGRCVFYCDNDVVDHQIVEMTFENGIDATLTMTAFTASGGRIIKFFGTLGEIVLNEEEDTITIKQFGKLPTEYEVIRISAIAEQGYSHGGGDKGLIIRLYEILCGNTSEETSLEASIESHLMGIYAEESRLQGGKLKYLHED